MTASSNARWLALVPLLLLAQAAAAHWLAQTAILPPPPDLSRVPGSLEEWVNRGEDSGTAAVQEAIQADQVLSRLYSSRKTGLPVSLFLAWFQSQTEGKQQPHSPKVCLPGSGWHPVASGEVEIATAEGPRQVNRYVTVNRGQRSTVLYWYQTPRRVVAGEWAAKFWLVVDALRDRRTDAALVRIVVWNFGRSDDDTTQEAVRFATAVYPSVASQLRTSAH
jgi:EpsI family protein